MNYNRSLAILSIFYVILFVSCDCGINEETLRFTQEELENFTSFELGDTLVYAGNQGNADTIIVDEVTPTIEEFDISCGFLSSDPTNMKSVFIRNHPNNVFPYTDFENHETAAVKQPQFFLNYQVLINPREVNVILNYKNFAFVSRVFDNFRIERDTMLGDLELSTYYRLPHSLPQRQLDSTYIDQVFWTSEEGIVAYIDLKGELFVKED